MLALQKDQINFACRDADGQTICTRLGHQNLTLSNNAVRSASATSLQLPHDDAVRLFLDGRTQGTCERAPVSQ